jgi:hypothetical protein
MKPQKKVRQMSKSFQIYPKCKKKNKNFYETLKGSSPCHTGRTFFLRNLFQFREEKKSFVGK